MDGFHLVVDGFIKKEKKKKSERRMTEQTLNTTTTTKKEVTSPLVSFFIVFNRFTVV